MSFNHFAAPIAALTIAAASAQAQNLSIQGQILYESPIGGSFIPGSGPGPADFEPGDFYNLNIDFSDLGTVIDFGGPGSSSNIFLSGDYGLNVGTLDVHGDLITQTFVHDNVDDGHGNTVDRFQILWNFDEVGPGQAPLEYLYLDLVGTHDMFDGTDLSSVLSQLSHGFNANTLIVEDSSLIGQTTDGNFLSSVSHVVPAPASMALLGLGGMVAARRHRPSLG